MAQPALYPCLVFILIMLVGCVPYASANNSSSVIDTTFDCEFLRQSKADELLNTYQQYESPVLAIADVYKIKEQDIDFYAGTTSDGQAKSTYRWFSTSPFFGTIQHFADRDQQEALKISAYSINEQPPSFILQKVIDCLGEPTYLGSFFFTIDADTQGRYSEAVIGFSLLYNDLDLAIMLVRPQSADSINSETESYLVGLDSYATGQLEPSARQAIAEGWLTREPWPPESWTSTP